MIERIERAAELGVRLFQIPLPSWGTLSKKETYAFFREVCGRFPEFRFLHYNLPRAGRLIMPHEYALLSETHPNLVGTKNASSDINMITGLLQVSGQLRHFFTEPGFAHGSLIGECGYLISIAVTNSKRAHEFFEAGVNKQVDRLMSFHHELGKMLAGLFNAVGDSTHMDGGYDKIFCKILDPRFPLRLLPPYQGAEDEVFETYRSLLREEFPDWIES